MAPPFLSLFPDPQRDQVEIQSKTLKIWIFNSLPYWSVKHFVSFFIIPCSPISLNYQDMERRMHYQLSWCHFFPPILHSTHTQAQGPWLQTHTSPAPSRQGSLQNPDPGGKPNWQQRPDEAVPREAGWRALWHSERAFWTYSLCKVDLLKQETSLGGLFNEPACSLMCLPSVRLSGEEVEGEITLGYQHNLSMWHRISTCWLCLPACRLFVQAATP